MKVNGKEPSVIIHGIRMSGVNPDELEYLPQRMALAGQFDNWLDWRKMDDGAYGVEWVYARGDTVRLSSQWYRCDNCMDHYRYSDGWAVWKYDISTTLCNECAGILSGECDLTHYQETVYG